MLTFRRIGVLVRHLPADSASAVADGGSGWRLEHYLLADVFHSTAGKPHPALPPPVKGSNPERDMHIRQAKARAYERARAIAAGEIT
jgi:hypothetical protein